MSEEAKRRAALAALELIEDGMAVGLGTGSTAALLVDALGQEVAAGLRVYAVATSERTARQARALGIPLSTLDERPALDLAIDGADEVDLALDLIKGGGGALLREKIVAACAARFVVIADTSKRVRHLGAFPLPVEVVPMAATPLTRRVAALGAEVALRRDRFGEPFATDEGHWILDCAFGQITDPPALARALEAMAGVVEHGLFVAMADEVILGGDDGVERLKRG
ncbi:MAG: ribose-5-phosphate isomerase RpiA [Rhodospirillales bacterium]|jgi:ribose 5-phosphate isomerase A|nr:ribose-5-phosphate isomerase RpiA [Alphaproteobacteria bacterium]MDP6883620.1 ribose-5-phosphate isomerase RpiA [Rhodospirillales bacterium]